MPDSKRNTESLHHRPFGLVVACLLVMCLLSTPLQAQQAAAKVQFVVGDVSAKSTDGKMRQLKKGDRIFPGDTIKTGNEGSAQLIYRDRSRMAVRVNTEFKIKKFEYDDKNRKGAVSFFSLLGGALRTVTGLIGSISPQNVTIDTPLATIGIRGTDHEIVHITPDFNGGKPIASVGTYNMVYKGATIIRTTRGNLQLGLNQVGFVGGSKGKIIKPVRLKELPVSIRKQLINKIPLRAKKQPRATAGTTPTRDVSKTAIGETETSTTSIRTIDSVTTSKTLDSAIQLEPSKTLSTTTTLEPSLSTTISPTKTLDPSLTLDPSITTTISPTTLTAPTKLTAPKTLTSPTTLTAPTTLTKP